MPFGILSAKCLVVQMVGDTELGLAYLAVDHHGGGAFPPVIALVENFPISISFGGFGYDFLQRDGWSGFSAGGGGCFSTLSS